MNIQKLFMLLIASGIIFQACNNKAVENNSKKGVPVETQEVKATDVAKTYNYSGTIASLKKSTLSTRIMGQITNILAHEGDKVEKGQLLVSIRSNDIAAQKSQVEANITAVKAAFKNAETDFNRITSLYNTKSATQKELDDITTHYEMTKAQLTAAKEAKNQVEETMTYANIRAPYTGVITDLYVDAGDMANPGMPLIGIEAQGLFEVITRIPESEVNAVEKNDTVQVILKSSSEVITGIISNISPSSRFSGSQFEARILLQLNNEQKSDIRSGMFANVILKKGTNNKILIANELIVNRGQLNGIWTVGETGSALLKWTQLGKKYNDQTEILSGISAGDKLILQCEERLYNGLYLSVK